MSVRLYIGNLPKEEASSRTTSGFAEVGDAVTTKVIENRQMPWFWFCNGQ